jgi:hypothetical protein
LLGLLLGAAPAAPVAAQDVTVEPLDPAAVATPPVVTIEAVPPDAPVIDLVSGAEPAAPASTPATPAAAASNTVHSVQATPIAAAPIEHGYIDSYSRRSDPRWRFRAGWLFWDRVDPDDRAILTFPGETPRLDAGDFSYDYESGFELSLSRRFGPCWDLELRYLLVDGWSDSLATTFDGGVGTVVTDPPTLFGGFGSGVATSSSELESFELMPWYALSEQIRVGGGFRWLRFDDSLNLAFIPGAGPSSAIDIGARNDLYGFQLGADVLLWNAGRFSVETIGKIGIYGNHARHSIVLADPVGDPDATLGIGDREDDLAWVGEAGITAGYAINCRWTARVGYQLLWIDGLALAPEQLGSTTALGGFDPARTTTNTSGDVLLHGLTMGLEVRW